jgi:hypothetical protein
VLLHTHRLRRRRWSVKSQFRAALLTQIPRTDGSTVTAGPGDATMYRNNVVSLVDAMKRAPHVRNL